MWTSLCGKSAQTEPSPGQAALSSHTLCHILPHIAYEILQMGFCIFHIAYWHILHIEYCILHIAYIGLYCHILGLVKKSQKGTVPQSSVQALVPTLNMESRQKFIVVTHFELFPNSQYIVPIVVIGMQKCESRKLAMLQ